MSWADYDNDGALDIVLAGTGTQTNLICQVWRNTGSGVFTNLNAGLPGFRSGSVAWADFDSDGRLDLLLTGIDGGGSPLLHVYRNNTALSSTSAPRINRLTTLTDGGCQLSFDGATGFGYTVWASTNLIQWSALGIPNDGGPGAFQFTDRRTASTQSRYYRVRRP